MNPFNYLFAADLGRIGAAYGMVHQFVDNETVRILEISPCGAEAQIVLAIADNITASLIEKEAQSLFADSIYQSTLIHVENKELVETYLHQNAPQIKRHILFVEADYLSHILHLSAVALKKGLSLVEMRTLRTQPKSCQCVITGDSLEDFMDLMSDKPQFRFDLIQDARPSVRQLFEIKK